MISRDDLICAVLCGVPAEWHDSVAVAMSDTDPWSRWLVVYEDEVGWGWQWFDDPQEAMTYALHGLCPSHARWIPIDVWRTLDSTIRDAIEHEVPDWNSALP
jgi:hypothetical protein